MKIYLEDGTDEPVLVLDSETYVVREGLEECTTCKLSTATLTVEGENYRKVEICPDCLIKALAKKEK